MKRGFLVALVASLSACAPLQQAPLVYTSGQTVGIRVGVSPTQADTAEIVIGVKLLDAAYAPVAVARPELSENDNASFLRKFDKETAKELKELFAIREIYGVYGEELTPDAVKNLNAKDVDELKKYLQKLGAEKNAKEEHEKAKSALVEQQKKLTEASSKFNAINSL